MKTVKQFISPLKNVIHLKQNMVQKEIRQEWNECKQNPKEFCLRFIQYGLPSILSLLIYVLYVVLMGISKNILNFSMSFLNDISYDSIKTLVSKLFSFLKSFTWSFQFSSIMDIFYSGLNFLVRIFNNLDTQIRYIIQSIVRIFMERRVLSRLKVFYIFLKGKIKNLKFLIKVRLIFKPLLEAFLSWAIWLHLKGFFLFILSLVGFKFLLDSMILSFIITCLLQQICARSSSFVARKIDDRLEHIEIYFQKIRNVIAAKTFYR